MTLIAREKSDYTPIPEGTYHAAISAVVDLGLQDSFGATKRQLLIRYEFPDLRVECDGANEPRTKWQFYTLSLNSKSNLRRDLERVRGRGFTREELDGFDLMTILGHACEIEIIHDHSTGNPRDKIVDVGKYRGDGEKPTPELDIIRYTDGEKEQWDNLPNWIKEKIRLQVITASIAEAVVPDEPEPFVDDDLADVPF
jgi:hypothetical protein